MKKSLKMLLILTCILLFAACSHEHEYRTDIIKEATCVEAGVMTYTCVKCDDSYDEEIAALNHTVDLGICSACDSFVNAEYIIDVTENIKGALKDMDSADKEVKSAGNDLYNAFKRAIIYYEKANDSLEKAADMCGEYAYLNNLKTQINRTCDALPLRLNGSDVASLSKFIEDTLDFLDAKEGLLKEVMKISEDVLEHE